MISYTNFKAPFSLVLIGIYTVDTDNTDIYRHLGYRDIVYISATAKRRAAIIS